MSYFTNNKNNKEKQLSSSNLNPSGPNNDLALTIAAPSLNNLGAMPLLNTLDMDDNIVGNAAAVATDTARDALISPLLAENNREHIAIILANSSKTKAFKAAFGLIASVACLSYAGLWFGVLPFEATATGSTLNTIAIGFGALMLAHSLMDQFILWYLDVDFKKQAREVLVAFNQNISTLQKTNTELNSQISNLNAENSKYQKSNVKLQTSIRSLDSLIQNTTGQVSYWMDVAFKEDEDSKRTLRTLKSQLTTAAQQAVDGYQVFLGVASNLQGVQQELSSLTEKNKALTKEYKSILGQIIEVQKQLTEQKFIENLRQLARQVDHFADQGGRARLDAALEKANTEGSDQVILTKDGCLKLQSFLHELDQILSKQDALSQCEQASASNQKLWSQACKRLGEIGAEPL
jgi:hypothetical protein